MTFRVVPIKSNTQMDTEPIALRILEQISVTRPANLLLFIKCRQQWIIRTPLVRALDILGPRNIDLMAFKRRRLGREQVIPAIFVVNVRTFCIILFCRTFPEKLGLGQGFARGHVNFKLPDGAVGCPGRSSPVRTVEVGLARLVVKEESRIDARKVERHEVRPAVAREDFIFGTADQEVLEAVLAIGSFVGIGADNVESPGMVANGGSKQAAGHDERLVIGKRNVLDE